MVPAIFESLNKLKEKTKCTQISFSVEAEERDMLFVDFTHREDGLEFNVNIACSKDEFATTSVGEIADIYFAELATQKENAEYEYEELADCQ